MKELKINDGITNFSNMATLVSMPVKTSIEIIKKHYEINIQKVN